MCFSQDKESRFIACVTNETEPQLVFYDLKKSKHPNTTTLDSQAEKVTINPDDTHVIAVTGNQLLKVFRVQDSSIRAFGNVPKMDLELNFTDHEWLDGETLVTGTDKGRLFIVVYKDQKLSTFS